jgi:hypothetical protein
MGSLRMWMGFLRYKAPSQVHRMSILDTKIFGTNGSGTLRRVRDKSRLPAIFNEGGRG